MSEWESRFLIECAQEGEVKEVEGPAFRVGAQGQGKVPVPRKWTKGWNLRMKENDRPVQHQDLASRGDDHLRRWKESMEIPGRWVISPHGLSCDCVHSVGGFRR